MWFSETRQEANPKPRNDSSTTLFAVISTDVSLKNIFAEHLLLGRDLPGVCVLNISKGMLLLV